MKLKHILIAYFGLTFSFHVQAEALQDLDSIEQTAYVYALEQAQSHYDNPQVVMGKLDPRLRLQSCDKALTAFNNSQQFELGNQTIGVKCLSSSPWTVYVPLTIKLFKPVVVSSRALRANEIINEQDLKVLEVDISNLRYNYIQDPGKLIGQRLKYPVAMGAALTAQSVRPQKMVKRGQLITLVAETRGMQVKMSGTALSDGILGQRVRVKNSSSKRVVEGVVDSQGIVKVAM